MSVGKGNLVENRHNIYSTGPCPVAICGNEVYVTSAQYDKLTESGASFYCVAGHQQSFTPKAKLDEQRERLAKAEREAAAAQIALNNAERACPWPTCEGRILSSPRGLRQHMVKAHGAPWATPEVTAEEIGQVLNGRDPAEVVK